MRRLRRRGPNLFQLNISRDSKTTWVGRAYFSSCLFLILLLNSCNILHSSRKKEFSRCYNPEMTRHAFLRSDGFYRLQSFSDSSMSTVSSTAYLYFSEDGIVQVFRGESHLEHVRTNSEWDSKFIGTGIYKIIDDSISVRYLEIYPAASYCHQLPIKLLEGNILQPKSRHSCRVNPENVTWKDECGPLIFIESDTLPDLDASWYKNQKWFWCSDDEFEKWKE